jgi:hypothetical protein
MLEIQARKARLGHGALSKAVDEILNSYLEEFSVGRQAKEELEAEALFRLLNYCPPPLPNEPSLEKTAELLTVQLRAAAASLVNIVSPARHPPGERLGPPGGPTYYRADPV